MDKSNIRSNNGGIVLTNQRMTNERIRFDNPFSFKVGQVFTGFGIGCGIGIGVGRPINLGAIPVLNEVMSAARGATYAFSGVTSHVNSSFRKLGAKNIEAGVGCGVGIGHGFGIGAFSSLSGIALKPSALHQFQLCVAQAVTKMMAKFGMTPQLPFGQDVLPSSLQGGMNMMGNPSVQNPVGSLTNLVTKLPDPTSGGLPGYGNKSVLGDTNSGSRTEKVLNSFLQNPVLKGEGSEVDGRLKSENEMLHMVLKHQRVIEELKEENEKLRQILAEELKVPASKFQPSYSSKSTSPCSDCFECRRKQRKR